ncbi:nodulation protein NolB [Bradyrhizobium sp. CB1717]|uniref:nodulation protein NolB n=1 Tax=Bradyrhizobium sp. CB1717 TaxID=3039154 RepID=UPI0024B12910|nr:nodulation protein NolB [Bradyrhizobium sp. CB1717]WFU23485.1 nodulation protein NolB [Bradyrhizobium sp. CB1717]
MNSSMLFGVTSISANSVECASNGCSPAHAQFGESLAQAASNQGVASSVTEHAPAPSLPEVQRAVAPASPLGDRVLQSISAIHQGKPFPSGAVSPALVGEPDPTKNLQLGPAAQPVLRVQQVEVHPVGKPEGADHFDSALTNLRDVYNGVIQVSLISKGTGAVSSSLNKLLSAG